VPQVDIICLANSRKHGGRCVAGLRVDGSGWLRPVGTLPDGTLFATDYVLADGTHAAPMDVIRVGVRAPRPAPHQPENWVIDGTTWKLVARPMGCELISILQAAMVRGPGLLGGFSDRVPWSDFNSRPPRPLWRLSRPTPSSSILNRLPEAKCRRGGGSRLALTAALTSMTFRLPIPAGKAWHLNSNSRARFSKPKEDSS